MCKTTRKQVKLYSGNAIFVNILVYTTACFSFLILVINFDSINRNYFCPHTINYWFIIVWKNKYWEADNSKLTDNHMHFTHLMVRTLESGIIAVNNKPTNILFCQMMVGVWVILNYLYPSSFLNLNFATWEGHNQSRIPTIQSRGFFLFVVHL